MKMTNQGRYCNNVQTIRNLKHWAEWNFTTISDKVKINNEIKRLTEENEFLIKEGFNSTSVIPVKIVSFDSKINGNNINKMSTALDYKYDG